MISDKIKVLLVDDHAMVRNGVRMMLSSADDICVLAEAESAAAALKLVIEQDFDVALADISMSEKKWPGVIENIETTKTQAGSSHNEVVTSIASVTGITSEIMLASKEQSNGIEQVNQAIMQMDEVTQQNAALVEEAATAAQALQDQAQNLVHVVSVFKLSDVGDHVPLAQLRTRSASVISIHRQATVVMHRAVASKRTIGINDKLIGNGDREEF